MHSYAYPTCADAASCCTCMSLHIRSDPRGTEKYLILSMSLSDSQFDITASFTWTVIHNSRIAIVFAAALYSSYIRGARRRTRGTHGRPVNWLYIHREKDVEVNAVLKTFDVSGHRRIALAFD